LSCCRKDRGSRTRGQGFGYKKKGPGEKSQKDNQGPRFEKIKMRKNKAEGKI